MARPWGARAVATWPHVAPPPIRTRCCFSSRSVTSASPPRSITRPPSLVPKPWKLWPPPRTASGSPAPTAKSAATCTSETSAARRTAIGLPGREDGAAGCVVRRLAGFDDLAGEVAAQEVERWVRHWVREGFVVGVMTPRRDSRRNCEVQAQDAPQGRSLSGLRTDQMCAIRSPTTSKAMTVTVTPACWATRPGWPLTVRSSSVSGGSWRPIEHEQLRDLLAPADRHEGRARDAAAVRDHGGVRVEQPDEGVDVLGLPGALEVLDDRGSLRVRRHRHLRGAHAAAGR